MLDSGCSSVCPTRWKTVHYIKNNSILTPTQKADLINYCLRIHLELTRFCAIQKIFMPAALPFLSSTDQTIALPTGCPKWKQDDGSEIIKNDSSDKPLPIELQQLFLPSTWHSCFIPPWAGYHQEAVMGSTVSICIGSSANTDVHQVQACYLQAASCIPSRNEHKDVWSAPEKWSEGKTASGQV